ncbi:MAG: 50S ribosomal protein L10 [Anaerolineales bacterium]|nr:50S ribosomal protein L10 [Anaerolineales bacterium]
MAISKERKNEFVTQYTDWVNRSKALVFTEYRGLTMKDIDELRGKIREAGGEFHIVKNTLGKIAFEKAGLQVPQGYFEGTTAVGFAFEDVAAITKIVSEFSRTSEFVKIKGGYLENAPIDAEAVKSLAELPPLPVMRAQLLGTILAPASQLVRVLNEPARQVACVVQAFSEKAAPAAA